jgi:hypothetical protein
MSTRGSFILFYGNFGPFEKAFINEIEGENIPGSGPLSTLHCTVVFRKENIGKSHPFERKIPPFLKGFVFLKGNKVLEEQFGKSIIDILAKKDV